MLLQAALDAITLFHCVLSQRYEHPHPLWCRSVCVIVCCVQPTGNGAELDDVAGMVVTHIKVITSASESRSHCHLLYCAPADLPLHRQHQLHPASDISWTCTSPKV